MAIDRVLPPGLALLLAALAGGCTVGPNYHPPHAAVPASFLAGKPAGGVPSRPVAARPAVRWWRLFHDPILSRLEVRAASQNLDLRVAALRVAESRAQEGIAGAARFPSLGANASYTREQPSNKGVFTALGNPSAASTASGAGAGGVASGAGSQGGAGGAPSSHLGAFDIFQGGFDTIWELDLWGKTRRAVEAARADTSAAAYDRRGVMVAVMAEVARDYIALRGTERTLAITRRNLATAERLRKLTQDLASGGLSTALDVANAAAEVATVEAQIPPLEQSEARQINALGLLLGEPPGALDTLLATARPVPPPPPAVPVGLPAQLLRRRPDIRAAEARLHAATANIGVATADLLPDVSLSASAGLQAVQFHNIFDLAANQWAIGPSLTLPIFEGGKLRAQLRLTRLQAKEAAVNFEKSVLTALTEVDDALTAYRDEQRRRAHLAEAVTQDHTALGLAQARYAQGIASYIEVLDAERNLLAAEQALSSSTATVSTDLVALYKALGGGWQRRAAPARS